VASGDQEAAAEVFNRFARRLIGLARRHVDERLRQKIDPEDVVQSVFRSFFLHQMEGDFEVRDWDSLWSLLALITVRKCTRVRVAFGRKVRNLNREIQLQSPVDDSAPGWEALAREPTPAEAAALAELIDNLLNALPERDRQIVSLSLEGKGLREISVAINRAERTVRRALDAFRQQLEQALLASDSMA
jgi:RNA polymerase sigma-70 factor (ECF subfamily)